MNDITKLEHLIFSLEVFLKTLEHDSECQWTESFRGNLSQCQCLLLKGFTDRQLHDLGRSITSVYGGMGSFNDYFPGKYNETTGRYEEISGMENFEEQSRSVFESAQALYIK